MTTGEKLSELSGETNVSALTHLQSIIITPQPVVYAGDNDIILSSVEESITLGVTEEDYTITVTDSYETISTADEAVELTEGVIYDNISG